MISSDRFQPSVYRGSVNDWATDQLTELARIFNSGGGYAIARRTFADRSENAIYAQVRVLRKRGVIVEQAEPKPLTCDPERFFHVIACKCKRFSSRALMERIAESRRRDVRPERVSGHSRPQTRSQAPQRAGTGYRATVLPDPVLREYATTFKASRESLQGRPFRLGRGPHTVVYATWVVSLFEWSVSARMEFAA